MTRNALHDLARDSGLSHSKSQKGGLLSTSDLEAHILEAQSFAASLLAKHPSSFERGTSARGGWWGFPGDYEDLDPGDLETEALFSAVRTTFYSRYAPDSPLISFGLNVSRFQSSLVLTLELKLTRNEAYHCAFSLFCLVVVESKGVWCICSLERDTRPGDPETLKYL